MERLSAIIMNMNFNTFIAKIEDQILTPIIELVALGAFILFVFGVVQYMRNAGDPKKRAEGQQQMFWGVIGLVILFGANSLVSILQHIVGKTG
jgi:hypothetical protein